jgi:hypothetical protein
MHFLPTSKMSGTHTHVHKYLGAACFHFFGAAAHLRTELVVQHE